MPDGNGIAVYSSYLIESLGQMISDIPPITAPRMSLPAHMRDMTALTLTVPPHSLSRSRQSEWPRQRRARRK